MKFGWQLVTTNFGDKLIADPLFLEPGTIKQKKRALKGPNRIQAAAVVF